MILEISQSTSLRKEGNLNRKKIQMFFDLIETE